MKKITASIFLIIIIFTLSGCSSIRGDLQKAFDNMETVTSYTVLFDLDSDLLNETLHGTSYFQGGITKTVFRDQTTYYFYKENVLYSLKQVDSTFIAQVASDEDGLLYYVRTLDGVSYKDFSYFNSSYYISLETYGDIYNVKITLDDDFYFEQLQFSIDNNSITYEFTYHYSELNNTQVVLPEYEIQ